MDILQLSALLSGHSQNIDISSNTLVALSLKVGGSVTNTELTKAILDNLAALQDGSDFADGTNAHTHDGRYYQKSELNSNSPGTSGASLVGVSGLFNNYFPATTTAQGHFEAIDTALGLVGTSSFKDSTFRIKNDPDNTKILMFALGGISPSTTRTITMPDMDVDLGNLSNANIAAAAAIAYSKLNLASSIVNSDISGSAAIAYSKLALSNSIVNTDISSSAAIAYSKLALTGSIVNADISASAAIAYSKLALTGSIVNSDISASAAIAYSKLALTGTIVNADIASGAAIAYSKLNLASSVVNADISASAAIALSKLAALTANRALISDGSGIIAVSPVSATELSYVGGVTSAIQGQLDGKIASTEKGSANGVATLDGGGKIPAAQLPNSVMDYKGNWDASTNTPTLADGTGSAGDVYKANVAGTVNFGSGPITFAVGDWTVYNGTIWEKSNNSNAVNSVNGQTGTVVLTTTNIAEGSNLYFTDERAQDAVGSALGNTGTINLTYNDAGNAITADIVALSITNALISGSAAIAYSKLNLVGSIVNADISGSAAIAYSKLSLTASIVNADIAVGAAIAYAKLALTNSIVNADIAAAAAIAYSKLNLAGSVVNADIATGAAIAYSKLNLSASIVNADIAPSAAITYSKLVLTGSIVNADISASAGIVYSKLLLTNSIVDADIASAAAIALSKLAALTINRALQTDGSGVISVSATTANELSFLQGATGNIQTQFTGKANTALSNLASVAINTSLLPGADNSIDAGSASKRFANLHTVNTLLYGSTSGAITLKAADATTPYSVKFPATQAAGALTNDGSGNLSWAATSSFNGRSGQQAIGNASTSQAVTFTSTLGTTSYGVSVIMRNSTDLNPQFQPITITAKSATGFTATWNAPTDSANYVLEFLAIPNA